MPKFDSFTKVYVYIRVCMCLTERGGGERERGGGERERETEREIKP